ncbi:MAG: SDR family NAD(P)-dependent oxidoreductase, partial [bacterium]
NKVCVVTGGAQGFGEGIVRELIKTGAIVFIADLNATGAKKLAVELNAQAGRTVAFGVEVNVADEDSVKAMVDEIVLTVGGIDLFVSNAGVLKAGSVKEMTLKDFRFVTDVNYIGFFLCTKHVAPVMAAMNKPSGKYFTDIVAISSKSALEGSNKNGAYAGGKFGAIGLTQSFAMELVEDQIKVNSICPGNFFEGPLWSDPERGLFVQYLRANKVPGATSIAEVKKFYESKVPLGRGCRPEDVVRAILYTVEQPYETGQAIPVTGGQVMVHA